MDSVSSRIRAAMSLENPAPLPAARGRQEFSDTCGAGELARVPETGDKLNSGNQPPPDSLPRPPSGDWSLTNREQRLCSGSLREAGLPGDAQPAAVRQPVRPAKHRTAAHTSRAGAPPVDAHRPIDAHQPVNTGRSLTLHQRLSTGSTATGGGKWTDFEQPGTLKVITG